MNKMDQSHVAGSTAGRPAKRKRPAPKPVGITIQLSDGVLHKLAAAASEHELTVREHVQLIIQAAVALYEVEDQTRRAAGAMATTLRPQRFRPPRYRAAKVIHAPEAADRTAAFFGDPAPGRSALDERKRAALKPKQGLPPLRPELGLLPERRDSVLAPQRRDSALPPQRRELGLARDRDLP